MIYQGSRYQGSDVTEVVFRNGNSRLFLHPRQMLSPSIVTLDTEAIEHEIVEGDEIDALAFRYYDDESLYWIIAEVNSLLNLWELTVGQRLTIPSKEFIRNFL